MLVLCCQRVVMMPKQRSVINKIVYIMNMCNIISTEKCVVKESTCALRMCNIIPT